MSWIRTSPATTPFSSQRLRASKFTTASRYCICAVIIATSRVNAADRSALVVAAERVALHAVLRSPFVGHLRANLPQLREEFVAHAFFENLHRAALERFRSKADSSMNELHVLVAKFL